jgi:Flp pilus assembly protein TadD
VEAIKSPEELDRLGAAHALFGRSDAESFAPELLTDERRAIRLAAARALTPTRSPADASMTELVAHWSGRLDQPQASHDMGAWWLMHGNAEAALPLLRAAAEGDPRSGSAWRDLALALSRLQRDEEALGVARRAVTLTDDADLWRALGLLEAAAGHRDAATAALRNAVRLAPDDPRNQRNLDASKDRPTSPP